jgi:hypothetical protein
MTVSQIAYGAGVDAISKDGATPLRLADTKEVREVVKV